MLINPRDMEVPAALRIAWECLERYVEYLAGKMDWTLEDLDNYDATPLRRIPRKPIPEINVGPGCFVLYTTINFYVGEYCVVTVTMQGYYTPGNRNVWHFDQGLIHPTKTGEARVMEIMMGGAQDLSEPCAPAILEQFMTPRRPVFTGQILVPSTLAPGMRIGVQTIANSQTHRTELTIAEIDLDEGWISFEEWREGVGWMGEGKEGVPQEYTFADLGLAPYHDGSWHTSHHCYGL